MTSAMTDGGDGGDVGRGVTGRDEVGGGGVDGSEVITANAQRSNRRTSSRSSMMIRALVEGSERCRTARQKSV